MRFTSSPGRALRLTLLIAATTCAAGSARAYVTSVNAWPSGTIPMTLQLDATKPDGVALPLNDGSTSWNAMVVAMIADWNANLSRTKFTTTQSTSTATVFESDTPPYDTPINNVIFTDTAYDDSFGSRTLAVTFSSAVPGRKTEADVLVNRSGFNWNSYRGALRSSGVIDLRRVLLHEFGHVLGLNHPDQATPLQSVTAVMNSVVSNTETLQLDDTNGAKFLYSTPFAKSTITSQPASQTVSVTGNAGFAVTVDGRTTVTSDVFHGYGWYFAPPGSSRFEPISASYDSTKLNFTFAQATEAGRYYFSAITPDDTINSDTVTLTVNPLTLSTTTQLANVATRGVAGAGANSMIVGFVITGNKSKKILLRAIGPTLGSFNVPGTLADPILTLKNSSATDVAANNDWEQNTTATAAEIRATSTRVGAFSLAAGSKDAVILTTLPPGGYTALVSSPNGASGVALLEAYDADDPLDPAIKLANLSTRGSVGTGANIIIAGFVVSGPGPKTYLIRAIGPTLLDAPFNLAGSLIDPYLKLYQGSTLLRENDDWDSPATAQPALRAAAIKVGAFPLREKRQSSGLDSVMLVTLPPGSYSAQMSGFENLTGIGLIEVYEVPN